MLVTLRGQGLTLTNFFIYFFKNFFNYHPNWTSLQQKAATWTFTTDTAQQKVSTQTTYFSTLLLSFNESLQKQK